MNNNASPKPKLFQANFTCLRCKNKKILIIYFDYYYYYYCLLTQEINQSNTP